MMYTTYNKTPKYSTEGYRCFTVIETTLMLSEVSTNFVELYPGVSWNFKNAIQNKRNFQCRIIYSLYFCHKHYQYQKH